MLFLQDTRGIPSDQLNRVLRTMESKRHNQERQMPNILKIRESLEHQVSSKIEEKIVLSSGKTVTICHFISADGSEIEQPFHNFKWLTNFGT